MKHELKLALRLRWLEFRRMVGLRVDEAEFESLHRHFHPEGIEPLEEWDE